MEARLDSGLGLGERLRSARRARAMSLEQAARSLHLEESVLLALEEERFADLGAPVFVRGHLRSYARLLGLAEDTVLEAYRAADPASDAVPRIARDREKPLATSPGPFAVAGAVGVLVLAIAAWVFGSRDPAPVPAAPVPVAPAPPATSAVPAGPTAPAADALPATAPPPAGSVRLELIFDAASWVQVDDAGKRLADGEFPAGTTQVLDAVPPVDVTLGNAPGVRVRVDGAPYPLPDATQSAGSKVVRFRVEAAPPPATPGPGA